MQVIFNKNKDHSLKEPIAMALGLFDGLHIGHKMLCQQLKSIQYSTGCSTMVYTFLENPLEFLSPEKNPGKITTVPERIYKFHKTGLDYLILNPFDNELASTDPEDFLTEILLKRYNIKYIVVGYDFTFGARGKGDINLLKTMSSELDFQLVVVPPISIGKQTISSSLIRQLIENGKMGQTSMCLGGPYSISGEVVHGFGRGRKMGFPTANLKFNENKLVPQSGIYLTKVKIDASYRWGLTNVGTNPTFEKEGLFIETYILDFDQDIYGSRIKVEFLEKIREEKKFPNVEELIEQMAKDVQWAKNHIYKF